MHVSDAADLRAALGLTQTRRGPRSTTAWQMVTRQLADWGLGLRVSDDDDRRTFGHTGGNHGYQCFMLGTVQAQNGAALMISSDQGLPVAEAMAAAITASTSWQIT
jgi:hypothetical protein